MSSKATEEALGALHGELARVLKKALSQDFTAEDNPKGLPPAQLLNVARQLLKDNAIVADPRLAPEDEKLMDLPVFDTDEDVASLRH